MPPVALAGAAALWLLAGAFASSSAQQSPPPLVPPHNNTISLAKRGLVGSTIDFGVHTVTDIMFERLVMGAVERLFPEGDSRHHSHPADRSHGDLPYASTYRGSLELVQLRENEVYVRAKARVLESDFDTSLADIADDPRAASSNSSSSSSSILDVLARRKFNTAGFRELTASKSKKYTAFRALLSELYVEMPRVLKETHFLLARERQRFAALAARGSMFADIWAGLVSSERSLARALVAYRDSLLSIINIQVVGYTLWAYSASALHEDDHSGTAAIEDMSARFARNLRAQFHASLAPIPELWMRELVCDEATRHALLLTTADESLAFARTQHLFFAGASPFHSRRREYQRAFAWSLRLDSRFKRFIVVNDYWHASADMYLDQESVKRLVSAANQPGQVVNVDYQQDVVEFLGRHVKNGTKSSSLSKRGLGRKKSASQSSLAFDQHHKHLKPKLDFVLCTDYGSVSIFKPPVEELDGTHLKYYIPRSPHTANNTLERHGDRIEIYRSKPFPLKYFHRRKHITSGHPEYREFFSDQVLNNETHAQFFDFVEFNTTARCRSFSSHSNAISKSNSPTLWRVKTLTPYSLAEDSVFYENQKLFSENRRFYLTLSSRTCVLKIVDTVNRETVWRSHRSLSYLSKNRRNAQCQMRVSRKGRIVVSMDNTEHWKDAPAPWRVVWRSRSISGSGADHGRLVLALENDGLLVMQSLDDRRVLKRFN